MDDVIESAKAGAKVIQVIVGLERGAHQSLQAFAQGEGTALDDAIRMLMEEGLADKGFVEDV